MLTEAQIAQFRTDGYSIAPTLFDLYASPDFSVARMRHQRNA